MVDREARRQYAQLVRQFISGRMTNDEYEKRYERIQAAPDDLALSEMYHQIWYLYDDIQTHRLTGAHRLTSENRRHIARMVLFLQSDREFCWPPDTLTDISLTLLLFVDFWTTVLTVSYWPDFALLAVGIGVAAAVLFLGWGMAITARTKRRLKALGDFDVWPFLRREEMAEAVRQPRLLNGTR